MDTYLRRKLRVLMEVGLTDTQAVEVYLTKRTQNAKTPAKRNLQLDAICSSLIDAYYNGDRAFVKMERSDNNGTIPNYCHQRAL